MPPNIELTSLSSATVTSGSTLTLYGSNMAADDIAYFTPTFGMNRTPVTANGQAGGATSVSVTVPALTPGGYNVHLTTSMGNGESPALPVAVASSGVG